MDYRLLLLSLLLTGCINQNISETQIDVCQADTECIVVPHAHCCGSTKKAINAKYLDAYNSHPEWQKFDDEYTCARIGRCPPDSDIETAECVDNRCSLVYG